MKDDPERWWVISETELRAALKRARFEDPDIVFTELYANSEVDDGPFQFERGEP